MKSIAERVGETIITEGKVLEHCSWNDLMFGLSYLRGEKPTIVVDNKSYQITDVSMAKGVIKLKSI